MIGVLSGIVLFSDGKEVILLTKTGVGYQAFCHHILPEGGMATLYVSHLVREASEDLYCFKNLRNKKLFELLITVKGVGPKSAFNLISKTNTEELISAIISDQKNLLTRVSGIGTKAASQIILDLQKKINKVRMYSAQTLITLDDSIRDETLINSSPVEDQSFDKRQENPSELPPNLLEDTVLACCNLGFQSDQIIPLAQKILKENQIQKTEQLIHLVLKEI